MTALRRAETATDALERSLIDVYDFTEDQAAALAATVDPADIEPGSVAGIAERLASSAPCTHTTASPEHLKRCCSDGFDCAPEIEP